MATLITDDPRFERLDQRTREGIVRELEAYETERVRRLAETKARARRREKWRRRRAAQARREAVPPAAVIELHLLLRPSEGADVYNRLLRLQRRGVDVDAAARGPPRAVRP